MRITYITHFYPPDPCGGAGHYTAALAEGFASRGEHTSVLCAGDWEKGSSHVNDIVDCAHRGVRIRRINLNWRAAAKPFDYLYDNPAIEEHFVRYLKEQQPEIVHVTSCYALSARPILIARSMGLPVVVHLVDYWFICPRHTLLRKNGTICNGRVSVDECQRCLLAQTKFERVTRLLPGSGKDDFFRRIGRVPAVTRAPGVIGQLGDLSRRRAYALRALLAADIIIAPSETLRRLYVDNGVPAERITLVRYGHELGWANRVRRQPSAKLRLGFMGNVIREKGVHVLVEATRQLQRHPDLEVHIFGNDEVDPTYTRDLRKQLPPGVVWHGKYERQSLAEVLSIIDVLVAPSVWHENSPLVIQEAFAAGCPAIVSDVGGMAEVVRDGVDGMHFRTGDAGDLAARIEFLLADRERVIELQRQVPDVKTIACELEEIGRLYQSLLNRKETAPSILRSSGMPH